MLLVPYFPQNNRKQEVHAVAITLLVLSLIPAILVCSEYCSTAASQSQSAFPLPTNSRNGSAVMYYEKLGIAFVLTDLRWGGVERVYIFSPKNYSPKVEHINPPIKADELVPGQGAFGIRLGATASSLYSVPARKIIFSGSRMKGTPVFSAFYLDGQHMLYAAIENGVVSQIVVEGPFKTPEGITEQSTNSDIWKAYGEPDVFWHLNTGVWSVSNVALPLSMLVGGIIAGYLLRVYHRRRATQRRHPAPLIPLVMGALMAMVAATIGFWITSGHRSMILYPVIATTSFVSGLALTGVYEATHKWCISFLRCVAVLILMLAGTTLAVWVVFLLYPRTIVTWSILWLGIIYSLFSLGLLLGARVSYHAESSPSEVNTSE